MDFFAYIHTYVYRVTQKRLFDSECGTQWGERFYKVAISIILLNSINSIVFPFQLFFTTFHNFNLTWKCLNSIILLMNIFWDNCQDKFIVAMEKISYCIPQKLRGRFLQFFWAFSENLNFIRMRQLRLANLRNISGNQRCIKRRILLHIFFYTIMRHTDLCLKFVIWVFFISPFHQFLIPEFSCW